MQRLCKSTYTDFTIRPEKILQFGEGNFLRGFVDWQIQVLNEQADFNGSVVVVQPRGSEKIARLNKQNGLYSLFLQGIKDGQAVSEHIVIDAISRGINLATDYQQYVELAEKDELRFIVSNTTEAGIVFNHGDQLEDIPQKSFTGKLAAFLYHRFKAFSGDMNKGCVIIPCELIENNGEILKEVILQYASYWKLEQEFIDWLEDANTFCSSLVDRIVPGFPADSFEEKTKVLGYRDDLMVVGEHYHLWVIQGPEWLNEQLPFRETTLNTIIVDDLTSYRERKVRILNGTHTALTPVAYLSGIDTVEEAVNDQEIGTFITELIKEEIIPTLDGSPEELLAFANEVVDRFKNPFIKHYLLNISLNSISKFRTRNLPSLLDYVNQNVDLPKRTVFALSTLLYFYNGKRNEDEILLQDESEILQFFQTVWQKFDKGELELQELVQMVLAREQLWGMDLTMVVGLKETVVENLHSIIRAGVKETLADLQIQLIERREHA
ncbi:tagaturonate reductase [Fredinandcohnia quinoae]|uniref:Tagaturonate reductase n=1 Tax=Fredinandcohnia quinoae TaxID=2918902 RepID=A0AAW5DYK0_9BACI|nr:tagaturonate reductase [Fredinandcohnia sp. SECRCQ15]MCH1625448.1 tagaturonate reductase [Fredinandcohnia sp. SECRCQ15]